MDGTVIVGGGEAGLSVALALRDLGGRDPVTIVGDEPHAPYHRPPLSKEFLKAPMGQEELELRDPGLLADLGITVVAGHRVLAAVTDADGGVVRLDDDRRLRFDNLVIATGATPRGLSVAGSDARGVFTLRTVADARVLFDAAQQASRAVVVGGGFIGLEVAAALRARGMPVTVLEAAERILARVAAEPTAEFISRFHTEAGTEIRCGASLSTLKVNDGAVTGVVLQDGEELPADLVVVGIGAAPVTDLAAGLGLEVDGGVVVDAVGRSSHPAVWAVGDCASQPHPHLGDRRFRFESVNNAAEQGVTVARAILGLEEQARGVPWFWSTQGALKLQIAGVCDGYDDYVVRSDGGDRITVLYYRAGQLIAADAVNNPRDYNAVKRALSLGATLHPEQAADPQVALKSLLTATR